MTQTNPPSSAARLAFAFDALIWIGVVAFFNALVLPRLGWRPLTHILLPVLLVPVFGYCLHRFRKLTPGQAVHGLDSRLSNGQIATRPYDWIFNRQTHYRANRLGRVGIVLCWFAASVFVAGASGFLWMRDPTLRPYGHRTLPLFAPKTDQAPYWITLPFFYATGAFPLEASASKDAKIPLDAEFALPYEKGPPRRFLGRISVYWRDLDARLSITGPLTLPAPSTPSALRDCVQNWLRCRSERRHLWQTTFGKHFDIRSVAENDWFTVDNAFLDETERPQGIYLKSRSQRGRIREAYYLVGPKMAIQGFVLDRPDRTEGEIASGRLRDSIGSFRMSSDLDAPRAFLNPKLARLRIGPKSGIADLIRAEGHLLAKVSIEPKDAESFYHLAGLAITLYRTAKREGRIELAASSKTIVNSALRYANDVDPKSRRLAEMERFVAETETR